MLIHEMPVTPYTTVAVATLSGIGAVLMLTVWLLTACAVEFPHNANTTWFMCR